MIVYLWARASGLEGFELQGFRASSLCFGGVLGFKVSGFMVSGVRASVGASGVHGFRVSDSPR